MKELGLSEDFLKRPVNAGFSGGEKKRNEILQMAMLNPKLAVLDETDSGLDIDALRIVADGVNRLKGTDNAQVVITHYQRLLDYIVPDFVHVLYDGRIIKSGDKTLAHELEEKGYDWLIRTPHEQRNHQRNAPGTGRGLCPSGAGRRPVATASQGWLGPICGTGIPHDQRRGLALHQPQPADRSALSPDA